MFDKTYERIATSLLEMLTAVNNYADDTLLAIDDSLYKALSDVRRIRQGIMNSQNKNKQG